MRRHEPPGNRPTPTPAPPPQRLTNRWIKCRYCDHAIYACTCRETAYQTDAKTRVDHESLRRAANIAALVIAARLALPHLDEDRAAALSDAIDKAQS